MVQGKDGSEMIQEGIISGREAISPEVRIVQAGHKGPQLVFVKAI